MTEATIYRVTSVIQYAEVYHDKQISFMCAQASREEACLLQHYVQKVSGLLQILPVTQNSLSVHCQQRVNLPLVT